MVTETGRELLPNLPKDLRVVARAALDRGCRLGRATSGIHAYRLYCPDGSYQPINAHSHTTLSRGWIDNFKGSLRAAGVDVDAPIPPSQVAPMPKLTHRQRIVELLTTATKPLTRHEVEAALGSTSGAVSAALRELASRGVIETNRIRTTGAPAHTYRLARPSIWLDAPEAVTETVVVPRLSASPSRLGLPAGRIRLSTGRRTELIRGWFVAHPGEQVTQRQLATYLGLLRASCGDAYIQPLINEGVVEELTGHKRTNKVYRSVDLPRHQDVSDYLAAAIAPVGSWRDMNLRLEASPATVSVPGMTFPEGAAPTLASGARSRYLELLLKAAEAAPNADTFDRIERILGGPDA